ncbi:MAG: vWA domain-containing protein [Planctomycetota bacterium]
MQRGLGLTTLACLILAAVGVAMPWRSEPTVTIIVDRTPSTRTAAWHDADPAALIRVALGRAADEVRVVRSATQTITPIDTDIVVVFGDGRLPMLAGMPTPLLVTDPALDRPTDARIADLTPDAAIVRANRPTRLTATNATPDRTELDADRVVSLIDAREITSIAASGGDTWPENDRMTLEVPPPGNVRVWLADRPAPAGWRVFDTIPGNASVVYAERFDGDVAAHVERGGGLIVGDITALPPELRGVSPLSPLPPAGGREWLLLLDVSGSMGRSDRLERGIAALRSAAAVLPDNATRGVGSFAADLRWWERGVDPREPVAVPTDIDAGGPTNLRLALLAVAEESGVPRELLVLSDGSAELGAVDELATRLSAAGVRVSAVVLGASVPEALATIVERTGGVIGGGSDWTSVAAEVAGDALLPERPASAVVRWPAVAERRTPRVSAWLAGGATELATFDDQRPAVAVHQVGLGTVAAVAFTPVAAELEVLAERVAAGPTDPDVAAERRGDVLRVRSARPPTVRLDDAVLLTQRVTPNTYAIALPRPRPADTVTVSIDSRRAATVAVPSAYDAEFAELGNVGGDARIGERLSLSWQRTSIDISVMLGLVGITLGAFVLARHVR